MQVRFWGTRGSIAKCGPQILRYGGSTPCIEVLTDAGTLIVSSTAAAAAGTVSGNRSREPAEATGATF